MTIKSNTKEAVNDSVKVTKDFIALGEPDALIFFMSIGGVLWGLWLIAPWAVFSSTTTFAGMEGTLLSEWGWGLLFIGVHFAKFVAWLWDRLTSRPTYVQVVLAFMMFLLWGAVVSSVLASNWQSPATPVYGMFALASVWIASKRLALVRRLNRRGKEVDQ